MEIWKPVKRFDHSYEVSNFGRIRSIDRNILNKHNYRFEKGKVMVPNVHRQGYLRIFLSNGVFRERFLVHRLVAEAFIDNPDNKPFVNHKDNNPANNHADNLEWCTQKENVHHARGLGVLKPHRGEDNATSKLLTTDILEIRRLAGTDTNRKLAKQFNISEAHISKIIKREAWTHV